jgi:hypothetical protein
MACDIRSIDMKRPLVLALAAAAALFGATAANAARVDWSVGIAVPPVAVVAGPGYAPGPVYAPPVAYAPVGYAPRLHVWLPPLPPLPPLPRLAWFGHGYDHGYYHGYGYGYGHDHDDDHRYDHDDHGHDRHHEDRAGWRR